MFAGPARDDGGAPQRSDRSPHRDGKTPSTSSSGRPARMMSGPSARRAVENGRWNGDRARYRPRDDERQRASLQSLRIARARPRRRRSRDTLGPAISSVPNTYCTRSGESRQSECNRADQGQRRGWPDPDRVRLLVKYAVEGQSNHRRTHDSDGRRSPCPGSAVAARQLEQR